MGSLSYKKLEALHNYETMVGRGISILGMKLYLGESRNSLISRAYAAGYEPNILRVKEDSVIVLYGNGLENHMKMKLFGDELVQSVVILGSNNYRLDGISMAEFEVGRSNKAMWTKSLNGISVVIDQKVFGIEYRVCIASK